MKIAIYGQLYTPKTKAAFEKLLNYFKKFELNRNVKNLFIEILKEHYLINENSKIKLISVGGRYQKSSGSFAEILIENQKTKKVGYR